MNKKIRFGILGAGRIAHKFAKGVGFVDDAQIVSVASRSMDKAEEFADKFNIKNRYDSYQDLVEDEEVDVIYICTPNTLHKEHSILCFNHKKAVICEKPLGVTREDVEEMVESARENEVFFMEGMWVRFFPIVRKVKELVHSGYIGKVRMIKGDFGFQTDMGYDDIRFNKKLGGGSILDVGIYPISLSSMIYNKQPTDIKLIANIGKTGVDEMAGMIFGYDDGEMALLSSAITTQTPHSLYIIGEDGYIHIPNVWYGQKAIIKLNDKEEETINLPIEGNGYNYEVEEIVKCMQEGKLESEIMPHKESINIMNTIERTLKA